VPVSLLIDLILLIPADFTKKEKLLKSRKTLKNFVDFRGLSKL
jgi:hypothetical protein